jgi:predicted nucleotidyltransferase
MLKELNTLEPFFKEPEREFNVREFARITKISPATASKKLKELFKEKLLTERKDRGFTFYKAYLESTNYRNLKIFYNKQIIYESKIIEELNNFYLKPTIILFGSFSTGLDTETSDIDLVIISENKKQFPKLKYFEKKLKREIQIFAIKNFKELKNGDLINSVLNGNVIQGEINGFE